MKAIVYNIHPKTAAFLHLQIHAVQMEGLKIQWRKQQKLYYSTLYSLADEKDKVVLEPLVKLQKKAIQSLGKSESLETLDLSQIVIDHKESLSWIKQLDSTGKLFFNQRKIRAHFSETVDLKIESFNGKYRTLVSILGKEWQMQSVTLIAKGEPCWLILGEDLFAFHQDLSWHWIRRCMTASELGGKELRSFLADLKEEQGMGAPTFTECNDEPLPVIVLTDSTGAFANLFMNYSGTYVAVETQLEKWRQLDVEKLWKKDLIEGGFREHKTRKSTYYCPINQAADVLLFFLELGWEVRDVQGNQVVKHTDLQLALKSITEDVLVQGYVEFSDCKVSIQDVVLLLREKKTLIELKPGFVGLLSQELKTTCSTLIDKELLSDGVKLPKYHLDSLHELHCHSPKITFTDQALKQLLSKDFQKIEPKSTFRGKLREYQQKGVSFLSFLYQNGLHGILADDMGLGKTVQVLAFLSTVTFKSAILVVCPASLIFNWKQELSRFLPSFSVLTHHGKERKMDISQIPRDSIVLTSYALLRQEIEEFRKIAFSCVILDEAQVIKNPKTEISSAICSLKAAFRLSLTGTPVENHTGELLAQFKFLIPEFFNEMDRFQAQLASETFLQTIKRKVKPFLLRRTKSDVNAELPEKIEQTLWLNMGENEQALYDTFAKKVRDGVLKKISESGLKKQRLAIFEAILRLRQICCHPLLAGGFINFAETCTSAKEAFLFSELETLIAQEKKILIFSQFTKLLKRFLGLCKKREWQYAYLDGKTKDRESQVYQFQNASNVNLFFVSLKAGGVGLNLTAADYVILYEPWWNLAVENQAIDRCHRIGRESQVFARRYIYKDTIEEKMMLLKDRKKALTDDLFAGQSDPLDLEDVELLFSL